MSKITAIDIYLTITILLEYATHICYRNAERTTPEEDIRESQQILDREKESLQVLRLQLAKKNRAIVSIQRQLDNIPDRTELAQYQRRFLELYNQGDPETFLIIN